VASRLHSRWVRAQTTSSTSCHLILSRMATWLLLKLRKFQSIPSHKQSSRMLQEAFRYSSRRTQPCINHSRTWRSTESSWPTKCKTPKRTCSKTSISLHTNSCPHLSSHHWETTRLNQMTETYSNCSLKTRSWRRLLTNNLCNCSILNSCSNSTSNSRHQSHRQKLPRANRIT